MNISVCMATYNGGKYIREQVMSVLPQLGEDDEIVVSDDGSTDDTLAVLRSFGDSRIRIWQNEGEHGYVRNFENALKRSSGEFVFLCDQDDIWKPFKVKTMMKALETYDIVLHDAEIADKDGVGVGILYSDSLHRGEGFWSNLWRTRWLGCCMAFRRNVLDYALPFPRHIVGHDGWISSIGMVKFCYCYLPDVLMLYRRHGGNASSASSASHTSLYYKLVEKRLWLLIETSRRLIKKI